MLLLCVLVLTAPGRSRADDDITTIHSFAGTDGREPLAGLLLGGDTNFYGTTSRGGTGVTNPAGTVFRMTPAGDVTTLYTFDFQLTGDSPYAGVIDGGDGKLYGTTRGTGAYLGNVFRVGSGFLDLHAFSGFFFGNDGSHSEAGLVLGDDGKLYGTTSDGGAQNIGTVFRIGTDGSGYAIVHSFTGFLGTATGATPRGGLVKGGDGNFYGTTNGGGSSGSFGTVFQITPMGSVTTIHAFAGTDGSFPSGTLIRASDGKLYGTTSNGGAHGNGTVYRLATDGTGFTTLHSFDLAAGEGSGTSGVIEAGDGNFYGTTASGGASFLGTVFVVTPDGGFATKKSFAVSPSDGWSPRGSLVQGADGYLYGTTFSGGSGTGTCAGGCGTVFKVLPGVPPTSTTSTSSTTTTSTSSSTTSSIGATTSTATTPPPTATTSTAVSTTTSTAVQIPVPTTTLAPSGCAGTPDGPTFASILCRLEALRARVIGEPGLGAFGPKLLKNLDKALVRTDDGRTLCGVPNVKKAKSRLAQVKKALTQYAHRLKGLAARKNLDATLRATFAGAGEAIVPDVKSLRSNLDCPAAAPL
jgi:uncharacterized repeat protein (TIGR03803 family)